jgi:hypothetical protein
LTYDRFPMGSICTTTYDAQGRMVSRTGPIPMACKYRYPMRPDGAGGWM